MCKIIEEYEPILCNCHETTEKIRLLTKLSEELERQKPLHSLALSEEAFRLADAEGNEAGLVKSLLHIGRSLWLTGELERAFEKLLDGLGRARKINEHINEVEFLNALGNVSLYLKIYDRAFDYYQQGLNLAKAIKYDKLIASLLNNIGEIYFYLHDYQNALIYYQASLERLELEQEKFRKAVPLINLGAVYLALEKFPEAEDYIRRSLKISEEEKDGLREIACLHLLGKLAYKKGNREEATALYDQCLLVNKDVRDLFLEIELYIDYFQLEKDAKRIHQGIEFLYKGLALAEKVKAKNFVVQICSLLATSYETLEEVEKTVYYLKKYREHCDEITSFEKESKLRGIALQIKGDESQRKNQAFEVLTKELEEKTHELSRSYWQMKIINEIGQSITATLNVQKVFRRIYESINSLMDATVLGIGIYNRAKDAIEYKLYIEEGKNAPIFDIPLTSKSSWAVWCFKNRREIMINDVEKEYPKYLEGIKSTYGIIRPSLIFCPLILEKEIIGVVTVQSKVKDAYDQHALASIQALVSYIAIALNNAEKSEKLAEEVAIRKQSQLELEQLNRKLILLSQLDGLTEIPNRRSFDQRFHEEWERAKRDQLPLSLILVDVDHFKEYNDYYGHQEGDLVLIKVAQALFNEPKRENDFVARYGGDEFVAILPNTNGEGANIVAKKMLNEIISLQIPHQQSKVAKQLTLTIGAATLVPKQGQNCELLIRMADKALYRAKDKGKNRTAHYEEK